MAKYAVVNSGVVINIVEWDGVSSWSPPIGITVAIPTGVPVDATWTYNGSSFVAPTPTVVFGNGATLSVDTTLPPGEFTFYLDASSGAFNITPNSSGGSYTLIKIDASTNKITLLATINNQTNATIDTQFESERLMSKNGTNWFLG